MSAVERPEEVKQALRENMEAVPENLNEAKGKTEDFPKGMIVSKRLLVTGCPRSGTRAISAAFTNARFPIGHERSGARGISSSFFAAHDWFYPGAHRTTLERFRFDHIWHQTRHPLKVISSMADAMPDTWWHWQEKHSGVSGGMEPAGARCALYWVRWNRLVEKNHPGAWRYRIEDVKELWPEMCERLGIPPCEYTPDDDHGHSAKKDNRHKFSWDEIKSLDVAAYDDLRALAGRYGYGS